METADLIDATVGRRIASFRAQKGLTRDQLARSLGISEVNLVSLEEGRERCTSEQIVAMANILNVKPSTFFEEYDDLGRGSGDSGGLH